MTMTRMLKKTETIEEPKKPAEDDVADEKQKKERPPSDTESKVSPPRKEEKQEEIKSPEVKKEKDKDHEPTNTVSPAHEDSDFEDNIVVKVPPASDTRTEKFLGRRHGSSHPKPPGLESNSPKTKHQVRKINSQTNNEL